MYARSSGGDVEAGLMMAKAIRARRLSVVIRDYCYSSCVNYFVGAAESVFVERGALLMLHGDARTSLAELNRDFVEPTLIEKLQVYADTERVLGESHARFESVHTLQVLARTQEELDVTLGRVHLRCRGMSLRPWVPAPEILVQLGIVDGVVEPDQQALPGMMPDRRPEVALEASVWDPTESCRER